MKSAILVFLLCLGLGLGLSYNEFRQSNSELKNFIGNVDDLDAAVAAIRDPSAKPESSLEVVGGDSLKFGTMRRGSIKNHTFVLKNNGSTTFDVWFKASSCKCTVGKFEKATLKPGETTDVELEWRAEGFGDFAQTATLGTTIPGREEIKLTINGQITEAVAFDPPSLEMGDFLSNATHEFKGKILNFGDTPVRIASIAVADPKVASKFVVTSEPPRAPLDSELSGLDVPKEVVEFTVSTEKGMPSGNIATQLNFHAAEAIDGSTVLSSEHYPAFRVNGRCLNPIRIIAGSNYDENRDILDMGIAPSSQGIKMSFLFGIRTDDFPDANISLRKVTPDAAADVLKVTIGDANVNRNQKLFPVTVEVPAGTPPIEFNGASGKDFVKLTFDTNMEDSPEESIYVKFVIQQ